MIFNFMLFVTASTYWYMTGFSLAAIIGYIVLLMFHEKLAFYAILMSGAGIGNIIYNFWLESYANEVSLPVVENGIGIIYIIVLLIKAKKIFDYDELSLD